MSNGNGDPILYGTDVLNGSVYVIGGSQTLGDNNGNGRLDIGDATLLLRMLSQADTTRSWDVPVNDLNTNNVLDSGDAIRTLRAISDTEPPVPAAPASIAGLADGEVKPAALATVDTEIAVVTPAGSRGSAGQLVRVQINLQNIHTSVFAASFNLTYPLGALHLASAQAYRIGSLVGANSAVGWNVGTPGRIGLAVSSRSPWAARDGVLAEITFEVQPGAATQYAWPLALRAIEITADGYTPRSLPSTSSTFVGRPAVGGRLAGLGKNGSGQFQFTLTGDIGASYLVEASTDLTTWTTVTTVVMQNGGAQVIDPNAGSYSRRFYRTRPIE